MKCTALLLHEGIYITVSLSICHSQKNKLESSELPFTKFFISQSEIRGVLSGWGKKSGLLEDPFFARPTQELPARSRN